MFDLNIYPLFLEAGRELAQMPGLLVMAAPRKAARLRQQDFLLLACAFSSTSGEHLLAGADGLTPSQQQELLRRLAETYFGFAGSTTSGLRMVAGQLNDFLLKRNLQAAQAGQMVAVLNMAVIHGESLIIAHAGSTHTLVAGASGIQHFDDSPGQGSGYVRGLGLSSQVAPRFHQATVHAGDLLMVCAAPPDSWDDTIWESASALPFDALRRRLIQDVETDTQAVLVRFAEGKGQISTWWPAEAAAQRGRQRAVPTRSEDVVAAPAADGQSLQTPAADAQPAPGDVRLPGGVILAPAALPDQPSAAVTAADVPPPEVRVPAPSTKSTQPPAEDAPARGVRSTRGTTGETPRMARPARPEAVPAAAPRLETFRRRLASVWRTGRAARNNTQTRLARSMGKVIPQGNKPVNAQGIHQGRPAPLINLSPSWMLAVALLAPLLVVTIATTIYFRAGRAEQYQLFFAQAQQMAQQAAQQTDPLQQREAWTQTYAMVRKAEVYQRTDEAQALRQQAQGVIDTLESTVRINFQSVGREVFSSGVKIGRMVATLNDIYLLDRGEGRILRMYRTATGYEVDAKFRCNPGRVGAVEIGPLVDMVALAPNNALQASVMGIDAAGNLAYCAPGKSGVDSGTLAVPDLGWNHITAMSLNGETLYVLDGPANQIYRYDGTNGLFQDPSHSFFGATNRHQADHARDIAVDEELLYMLYDDGKMTLCDTGDFTTSDPTCTDPMPYGDQRPGYEPAPLSFNGTRFIAIETTQPPNPSLYALDQANKSVYHLSLRRLNLQRQYRAQIDADFPLPSTPATGFVVAPNRRLLLAFDNQIFFALLP